MEIQYKGLQYDIPASVSERADRKLIALKKYLGRQDVVSQAFVELGREAGSHISGRIWLARINFMHDGTQYRAEALEESIEKAIDQATDELGKELRRSKKKSESLLRKNGLSFKHWFQQSA